MIGSYASSGFATLSLDPGVVVLDCAASSCGVGECACLAFFRVGIVTLQVQCKWEQLGRQCGGGESGQKSRELLLSGWHVHDSY